MLISLLFSILTVIDVHAYRWVTFHSLINGNRYLYLFHTLLPLLCMYEVLR
jgi:hypothetical protein